MKRLLFIRGARGAWKFAPGVTSATVRELYPKMREWIVLTAPSRLAAAVFLNLAGDSSHEWPLAVGSKYNGIKVVEHGTRQQ